VREGRGEEERGRKGRGKEEWGKGRRNAVCTLSGLVIATVVRINSVVSYAKLEGVAEYPH